MRALSLIEYILSALQFEFYIHSDTEIDCDIA